MEDSTKEINSVILNYNTEHCRHRRLCNIKLRNKYQYDKRMHLKEYIWQNCTSNEQNIDKLQNILMCERWDTVRASHNNNLHKITWDIQSRNTWDKRRSLTTFNYITTYSVNSIYYNIVWKIIRICVYIGICKTVWIAYNFVFYNCN